MTRRRWIADSFTGETATLRGEQAHHLTRVLRAQPGMVFDVVAGGAPWRASISALGDDAVVFQLLDPLQAESALPLAVLLSVFKFDRMEWAIEKATELGASAIIPVLARRTEKHLAQAAPKRAERWRRIALEAGKQSRRTDLPEIWDPLSLRDALAHASSTRRPAELRLLLAETETATTLAASLHASPPLSAVTLAIGPEGGWAPEESTLFAAEGWRAVSLGPRILRAETAAVAALAICGSALSVAGRGDPTQQSIEPRS